MEDEDVPEPPHVEATPTSSDQIGFQVRKTTSASNGEHAAKKAKKKLSTSKVKMSRLNLKPLPVAASSSSSAANNENEKRHAVHPKNFRMCLCGFTTHVTNLRKHIWRLTDGRHTTRGPHICPKCGDRFKAKSALRKHVGAHTNGVSAPRKKPKLVTVPVPKATNLSTCITCQRTFPNKRALRNHKRKSQ